MSGATQVAISPTASAVNYLQLTGAATGAAPTISAQGSDGTVGLNFATKGNNTLQFQTNSGSATALKMTTAGVTTANYFQTEASNTGISPKLYVLGTDTDISLQLVAKGAGSIVTNNPISSNSTVTAVGGVYVGSSNQRMYQGSATSLSFQVGTTPSFLSFTDTAGVAGFSTTNPFLFTGAGGTSTFKIGTFASAVNFIQVDPALTTAAPTIYALGSDANINLKITPKGTGGLQFTGPLLPNNLAGTSGQVLTSAGAGAVPTWAAAVSSNITANGLFENNATISANYTIGSGNNAVSAGPITINSGVVVTVPSGSTWVVV
jgi:hypothetical protein